MKIVKKILIILLIVVAVFSAITYLDYFLAKSQNTIPKIVLKSENKIKQMKIYKGLFYKVIKCSSNNDIIYTDYESSEDVCPRKVTYDKDGYFTNTEGYKISKKEYKLMSYQNIYTFDTIDSIDKKEDIDNYTFVAFEYLSKQYILKEDIEITHNEETLKLAIFPTFKEENETYEFVYDEENVEKLYCVKTDENNQTTFSKYNKETQTCEENFEKITMDSKWCKLYKNSTLVYSLDENLNYCK